MYCAPRERAAVLHPSPAIRRRLPAWTSYSVSRVRTCKTPDSTNRVFVEFRRCPLVPPHGLVMRAILTAAVSELTRPTNSSMSSADAPRSIEVARSINVHAGQSLLTSRIRSQAATSGSGFRDQASGLRLHLRPSSFVLHPSCFSVGSPTSDRNDWLRQLRWASSGVSTSNIALPVCDGVARTGNSLIRRFLS